MSSPCPKCAGKTKCIDSRPSADTTVYRRFTCPSCACRFSTVEVIVSIDGETPKLELSDRKKSNSNLLKKLVLSDILRGLLE